MNEDSVGGKIRMQPGRQQLHFRISKVQTKETETRAFVIMRRSSFRLPILTVLKLLALLLILALVGTSSGGGVFVGNEEDNSAQEGSEQEESNPAAAEILFTSSAAEDGSPGNRTYQRQLAVIEAINRLSLLLDESPALNKNDRSEAQSRKKQRQQRQQRRKYRNKKELEQRSSNQRVIGSGGDLAIPLDDGDDGSGSDHESDIDSNEGSNNNSQLKNDTALDDEAQDGEGGGSTDINSPLPNLLFIVCDQLRYDAIGYVQKRLLRYKGKVKIKTPNIDRLAAAGAWFRDTYW